MRKISRNRVNTSTMVYHFFRGLHPGPGLFGARFHWAYLMEETTLTLPDITHTMVLGSIPFFIQGFIKLSWYLATGKFKIGEMHENNRFLLKGCTMADTALALAALPKLSGSVRPGLKLRLACLMFGKNRAVGGCSK